ncbi:zinc transport system substrate-binding protein [Terribacillus halophilus]|uniref:Zinc transport system substrate-binding protein n=1 Tax=Terribacillus halophilus TaxID=361279 RepID=A0A1G6PYH8_9BACI|nr:zinc ABC transporter substrate-binding protein [Terribacillus halophilus]SDC85108.1 zinc transport system substrate-binding protein [Terribacillus halophilus]
MKKNIYFFTSLAFISVLFLGACSSSSNATTDKEDTESLNIYTTIYPIQYFAETIGGDHVNVESIIPNGSDAHTFEPTSNQMVDIAKGDAFFYASDEMETYASAIANAIGEDELPIVEMAEGIDQIPYEGHDHEGEAGAHSHDHEGEEAGAHSHDHEGEEAGAHSHDHEGEEAGAHSHDHEGEEAGAHSHDHEGEEAGTHDHDHEGEAAHHHHGDKDPHIWLDPLRAKQLAENMKNELIALDPDNETDYEANFEKVANDLSDLDLRFKEVVKDKPTNKIIVSHAAYGYWEANYGIEQVPITGLSPSDEPSQKELEGIIHTAEDNDLNYVLFEQNISPKVAEVVQEEIGADILRIHNLETLTEEDIENNEDYITLMDKNIEILEQALTNE